MPRKLGINSETVTKRCNRYAGCHEEMTWIEREAPMNLCKAIEGSLYDTPRSWVPATFTDEQIACI